MNLYSQTEMWKIQSARKEASEVVRRKRRTKRKTEEWFASDAGQAWLDEGVRETQAGLERAIELARIRMAVLAQRVKLITPFEKRRLKLVEKRDKTANILTKTRNELLEKAAKAETAGWKETYERDAAAATYKLVNVIPENGKLEVLNDKVRQLIAKAQMEDNATEEQEKLAFSFVPFPPPIRAAENSEFCHEFLRYTVREIEQLAVLQDVANTSLKNRASIVDNLKEQLLSYRVEECEFETHREFEIVRKVFMQWQNMGLQRVFHSWVFFALDKKRRRERLQEREVVNATLEEQSSKVRAMMMELEMEKWITHTDPFTEMPYYEHIESGEIVWEIPDRGWVRDRGELLARAQARQEAKLAADETLVEV